MTSGFMAVLFLALGLSASDVTGKWSGSLEGKGEDGAAVQVEVHADLKQADGAITGMVWKEAERQFALEKGKIEGDRISFEFTAPEGDENSAITHRVKLSMTGNGRLEGEVQFEIEGTPVAGKLTLLRDKITNGRTSELNDG